MPFEYAQGLKRGMQLYQGRTCGNVKYDFEGLALT